MSVINITGDNNELNAILASNLATLSDPLDINGNPITGNATFTEVNNKYMLDISGNNHEVNTVQDSNGSVLTDGTAVVNNDNTTGI
jgi:hypothetical protein